MGETVYSWLTSQHAAYMALPPPIRAGIERIIHFLGLFLLGMAGAFAAGIPWQQAVWGALPAAAGGQYSLHHQLPRDPRIYQDRVNDLTKPVMDEDLLH